MKFVIAAALMASSSTAMAQSVQITRDNGAPVGENRDSKTAGDNGGVLLEDITLIEKLARFDRERIPERVVHARGTGAKGEFVVGADLSRYTSASLFQPGKKTPVFVRFSSVIHGKDSPEGLRDPRGFAVKFYTDQGNWDLVGNNLPVFFIRDAKQFPDMVHSLKPDPVTNRQNPNRFFDFFSHTPESTHMITQLFSDLGTPASYREMDGNGVHTFRLVSASGQTTFARFRWRSHQGVKTLSANEASARPFDYMTADLYENITKGNFPRWDLHVMLLKPEDIAKLDYNPFDATKDWYGVPEVKVGTMVLNEVPENFHAWTEQSAFAPSNLVPGIEPSSDRLLQGRLFSYADTHRHRLGGNHMQLPVNAPRVAAVNNSQDGLTQKESSSIINYFPSVTEKMHTSARFNYTPYELSGLAQAKPISLTNNFSQAGIFWRKMKPGERAALIANLSGDLGRVANPVVKTRMVSYFYMADRDYGARLARAVNVTIPAVEQAEAEYRAAEARSASAR